MKAAAHLRDALAERAALTGWPAPAVTALGWTDAISRPDPERRDAIVHLTPATVLIGPWSAAEACGQCLAVRWQRLRTRTERDALETGDAMTAVGEFPLLLPWAVDAVWAVYEAIHADPPDVPATTDEHSAGLPRVTRVDLRTLAVNTMPLLPEPLCPFCAAESPADEMALRSRTREGSYRLVSALDYPIPASALVNPVCGALGAGTLMNVTSPTTAPVSGGMFVRGYGGLLDVSWSGQANSFAASRRLAYLEGLERYAGTHRRRIGDVLVAPYAEVADRALDPAAGGLYRPEGYADPTLAPYDPDAPIPWLPGRSLRDDRPILVPRRLVHYSSLAANDNFVQSSSSGCATGSCVEEAILYGLLELVERDAFLLGWHAPVTLPRIDLDSVDRPDIRAMVDRAALAGYDIHAYDNRVDLPFPAVTALAVRRDDGPGALAFAAAAHPDPAEAVAGALSEALTYVPHLARSTRRRHAELLRMADDFTLVRRLADHSALYGLPSMRPFAAPYLAGPPPRPFDDLYADWYATRPATGDLLDDVRFAVDAVAAAGSDVIAVDQTTPEQERAGVVSVCVIAPGLLPIDFGWTRQRALDAPRMLTAPRRSGLADRDLTPADLRRVPHPFP